MFKHSQLKKNEHPKKTCLRGGNVALMKNYDDYEHEQGLNKLQDLKIDTSKKTEKIKKKITKTLGLRVKPLRYNF